MPKIFISYRRADSSTLATLLAIMLKPYDVEAFVDTRNLDGGGPFPNRLRRAIEECDVFVCLLGETTLDSEWVRLEIEHANKLNKVLVPVFQERYKAPSTIPDDHVYALLQSDGVHILDVRNLYIDAAVSTLAELILKTRSQTAQPVIPTSQVLPPRSKPTPPDIVVPTTSVLTPVHIVKSFPTPGELPNGIACSANGLLIADNSATLFEIDLSGKPLAVYHSPDPTPTGLGTDGKHFWVQTTNRNLIYPFQINGRQMVAEAPFASPSQTTASSNDMAWDGSSLWYADNYSLHQLDIEGNILQSLAFAKTISAVAWDGNHLWIAQNASQQLSKVDLQGNIIQSFQSPIAEIRGMAWCGKDLWAVGHNDVIAPYQVYQLTIPSTVETPYMVSADPEPTETDHSALIQQLTAAVLQFLPPPFDWCFVPGGSVTLDTKPPKTYTVDDFLIAKYAITNAQFQVFVDAQDGYMAEKEFHWFDFSEEGRIYRTQHRKPKSTAFEGDNIPRTNISWYDAVAFCRWLVSRIQQPVILPTEQQWQRAAVGDNYWIYPWGNEFDPTRCNTQESGIGQPVNVTDYPNGESPFGVYQMCGNVYDWCLNNHEDTDDISLNSVVKSRVVRGGSYRNVHSLTPRSFHRRDAIPNSTVNDNVGFRCAISILESRL